MIWPGWNVVGFALLAAVTVYSAYRVVTSRVITHAALFLALTFVGMAGLFLQLGAAFLAAVQVLIYAGAVMAVIIFAIMLSEMPEIHEELSEEEYRRLRFWARFRLFWGSPYWGFLPLVVSGGLLAVLLIIYRTAEWAASDRPMVPDTTGAIGIEMFSTYLVPFEIASVVLLVAMVGAIVLTKREES